MRMEDKKRLVDDIKAKLEQYPVVYLTDTSGLDAAQTQDLRRFCFNKGIKLQVVKNTLLKKAMEQLDSNYEELYEVLKGNTSLMFADTGNLPAKTIKEFTKKFKSEKPVLKGAFVEEMAYIGADQLEFLANIKSKEELIGDIIALLQSPAKNVISALQSGGNTIAGLVKTLSERPE